MKTDNKQKYIVGIGASAGGLEAIQNLLAGLPSNTGFSYIIVQHLSPDYKSLLGEILSKHTDMPVIQAEEGLEVLENYTYVIQPGKNMKLSGGKLHLTDQVARELNLPIDIFFRSLAEEAGSNAIAIVLSGTGSDGTNGIKAIKENDGMVIVQDIESAKFDGMPRNVIRTGLADAQMSPEEIAVELQHISQAVGAEIHERTESEIDSELMRKVYMILKKVSNVNFTHYKQTTIIRRMERRMMLTHKDKLSDYVDYLYESPEEAKTLSKEVLIGVTNFFRDPDFFKCLKDRAIEDIFSRSSQYEPIRIWVAGCSTGEEAYSMAIICSEVMEYLKIRREVKIFATDLDVESINKAGKGVYDDNIVDSVSPARLNRYFTRRNNTYTVNRDIRKMIVFSPHNVFQDPPFGRLDLISCRNMLIYFQPVLQNDLFSIFHASLKDGGYLFLGKSEAIGSYTEAFPVIDAAAKIFSHKSDVKIPGSKKVPYLQTTYMDDDFTSYSDAGYARVGGYGETSHNDDAMISSGILERFLPACLIVNDKNELIHSYGERSNFVHLPLGRCSSNLFDLITEGLKIPISTLLKESREKKKEVQYTNIHFEGEHEKTVIDLTITPVGKNLGEADGLYAIVLSERGQNDTTEDSVVYEIDRVASQRITDLEQSLAEVQGKLDKSIAEQECVNEELQAANEELLTANEELQSSNEELQSVNEELYTVNTEYQQKLNELADLNDDIANFLTSTLTGIIFVDNKLNIRRYTDYVTSEFSVMDHDIGRSLAFISYHFPAVDITEICTNVLKTLVPDEREISTSSNKVFFMRVAPYRSTENKILGCVITLMDITSQKQGQVILQNTEKQLSMAQQVSEAKSDYLSQIAHEIITPIISISDILKNTKSQIGDNEVLHDNIEKIAETVNYMTSIITNISEASISERAAGEQADEPFILREVIENVYNTMAPVAKKAKISYEVLMDDDFNPTYVGNKKRLQQILINFISNSIKYTKENGSVSLRVFEELRQSEKARLCCIISDTGIGIKKEYIPMLFKPFTNPEHNNDGKRLSMGFDLSIAYNLISSMDGDVSVESEEGKGSTFTFHVKFDRYNGDKPQEEHIIEPQEYNLQHRNILVAEDNALNRIILCALLKNKGMTYVEAQDGALAVREYMNAPEYTFDCILMDMKMPNVDGIKATELIRNSNKADARSIPIIGVSANGFADDIRQARNAGIDDYATKPIDRDKLLQTMSRLISHK